MRVWWLAGVMGFGVSTSAWAQDAVVQGDFDCDGTPDLASGSPPDGKLPAQVRISYGAGLGEKTSILAAGDPEVLTLSVTDLDEDGCDDLAVAIPMAGVEIEGSTHDLLGGIAGELAGQSLLPEVGPDGALLDTTLSFEPTVDGVYSTRQSAGGFSLGLEFTQETWTCTRICFTIFGVTVCSTCCTGNRNGVPWEKQICS